MAQRKLYAHAVIEDAEGRRVEPGEEVPRDLPGLDELLEAGSVGAEPYEPPAPEPPAEVEIEGVVYRRAGERASASEAAP